MGQCHPPGFPLGWKAAARRQGPGTRTLGRRETEELDSPAPQDGEPIEELQGTQIEVSQGLLLPSEGFVVSGKKKGLARAGQGLQQPPHLSGQHQGIGKAVEKVAADQQVGCGAASANGRDFLEDRQAVVALATGQVQVPGVNDPDHRFPSRVRVRIRIVALRSPDEPLCDERLRSEASGAS